MAACMALNLDDFLDAESYERIIVLCKGHALDMPRNPYFYDGELSGEEEEKLITLLYTLPSINALGVSERYCLEKGIINLGKRFLQMQEFVENNKEKFFVYEGDKVNPSDVISFVDGDIAVYSVDPDIVEDLVEQSFSDSGNFTDFYADNGARRLIICDRNVYFVGRKMKNKFDDRADQAQLERYMLEADVEGKFPELLSKPEPDEDALGTVTRIMMEAKEKESAGALELAESASRRQQIEDDIEEVLRDDGIQEVIMLTEKGTNDTYEGKEASGDEVFMSTLFPDGKSPTKVIVLEHYKLKIKNGKAG
jgi:hypothetical protein